MSNRSTGLSRRECCTTCICKEIQHLKSSARIVGQLLFYDIRKPVPVYRLFGEKPGVRRKPAPDTLFEAMRLMGAERENCVYIGDTEVDIQTAKNAAMPCISVSWGFRSVSELKEAGAEIIADSAEELKKILLEA